MKRIIINGGVTSCSSCNTTFSYDKSDLTYSMRFGDSVTCPKCSHVLKA